GTCPDPSRPKRGNDNDVIGQRQSGDTQDSQEQAPAGLSTDKEVDPTPREDRSLAN
ncbi:UNVERIFIED_CONTAM: hypothetical protein K2H54_068474, partial [Gekko kuhli]